MQTLTHVHVYRRRVIKPESGIILIHVLWYSVLSLFDFFYDDIISISIYGIQCYHLLGNLLQHLHRVSRLQLREFYSMLFSL